MHRPPIEPSHLNSPVVHHRTESGGGPMRLWATVAAGVVLVLLLAGVVMLLGWLGGVEETQESLQRLVGVR